MKKFTLCLIISTLILFTGCATTSEYAPIFEANFAPMKKVLLPGSKDQSKLQNAIDCYQEKDYYCAIKTLQPLIAKDDQNAAAQFYLGLSYLGSKQSNLAINALQKTMEIGDPAYDIHTRWYLGLAYLDSDQIEKAVPIFQTLAQQETTYRDHAQDILDELGYTADSPMPEEELAGKSLLAPSLEDMENKALVIGLHDDISLGANHEKELISLTYKLDTEQDATLKVLNEASEVVHVVKRSPWRQGDEWNVDLQYLEEGSYTMRLELSDGEIVEQAFRK